MKRRRASNDDHGTADEKVLIQAADDGLYSRVHSLLEKGINVNAKNNYRETHHFIGRVKMASWMLFPSSSKMGLKLTLKIGVDARLFIGRLEELIWRLSSY